MTSAQIGRQARSPDRGVLPPAAGSRRLSRSQLPRAHPQLPHLAQDWPRPCAPPPRPSPPLHASFRRGAARPPVPPAGPRRSPRARLKGRAACILRLGIRAPLAPARAACHLPRPPPCELRPPRPHPRGAARWSVGLRRPTAAREMRRTQRQARMALGSACRPNKRARVPLAGRRRQILPCPGAGPHSVGRRGPPPSCLRRPSEAGRARRPTGGRITLIRSSAGARSRSRRPWLLAAQAQATAAAARTALRRRSVT